MKYGVFLLLLSLSLQLGAQEKETMRGTPGKGIYSRIKDMYKKACMDLNKNIKLGREPGGEGRFSIMSSTTDAPKEWYDIAYETVDHNVVSEVKFYNFLPGHKHSMYVTFAPSNNAIIMKYYADGRIYTFQIYVSHGKFRFDDSMNENGGEVGEPYWLKEEAGEIAPPQRIETPVAVDPRVGVVDAPSPPTATYIDSRPHPGYDVDDYLKKNLRYPKNAARQHLEGQVWVKFLVDKYGNISDPLVMEGLGSGCDEEAVRLILSMPPWEPGLVHSKKADMYYLLPIVFKNKN